MSRKQIRLTELASSGGCCAKLGPEELAQVLLLFNSNAVGIGKDKILVGLQSPDDALVYQIDDEQALIQSLDFFPPIVDDPYTYGAISAANATGDIYAMGGEVLWALNIVAFPDKLSIQILSLILQGGADKILEAGGFIGGGHSIRDDEPKYGMCVTGLVSPKSIWRKDGARKGDILFTTKALGTGLITSAAKQGSVYLPHLEAAIASMMLLNQDAARCLRQFMPSAVTDVTGFGILGHAFEMTEQSHVSFELYGADLPILDGALEYARSGVRTSVHPKNKNYLNGRVDTNRTLDDALEAVLYDPQTSGGLLIAIEEEQADRLFDCFIKENLPIWRIGRVHDGEGLAVTS